jgi:glycosyltransferase involved in cell wall biosynthesis
MKIVIGSNSPFTNSGYGIQSYFLCKSFIEAGHDVVFIAWNMTGTKDLQYNKISYEKLKELSLETAFYNKEAVEEKEDISSKIEYYTCLYDNFPCIIKVDDVNKVLKKEKADLYIYLLDIWIIESGKKFCCPSMTWLPLHFTPLEDSTKAVLPTFDKIIYLCKFGRDVVNFGLPELNALEDPVVPHFIDYDYLYNNVGPYNREYFRKELGITEIEERDNKKIFLISIVARNSEESNRKFFDISLQAFKLLLESQPELNAYLYIHTTFVGKVDLNKCVSFFNVPGNRILVPDQLKMIQSGYKTEYMNGIYLGSDVLLAGTGSEGFGLPILEAQLFGCPVVTTKCTAMLEYLYNGEYINVMDEKFVYANTSFWYLPDVFDIPEKIMKIVNRTPEESQKMKEYGIEQIKNNFSIKTVGNAWLDEINKLVKSK